MSRNKEKACSTLNRYYEYKLKNCDSYFDPSNRPTCTQSVKLLQVAEACRMAVISEFLAKLSEINNPLLDEGEVRTLNAALQKLNKEKIAWEHHVILLGGTNYLRLGRRLGVQVNGHCYYGRARELPEAKENQDSKSFHEAQIRIFEPDYYGQSHGRIEPPSAEIILLTLNNAIRDPSKAYNSGVTNRTTKNKDIEKWLVEIKRRQLLAEVKNLL